MNAKVCYGLREQLDQYSVGFSATEFGISTVIFQNLSLGEKVLLKRLSKDISD
jgi:hypothetical protein